jgi:hypothetical protein
MPIWSKRIWSGCSGLKKSEQNRSSSLLKTCQVPTFFLLFIDCSLIQKSTLKYLISKSSICKTSNISTTSASKKSLLRSGNENDYCNLLPTPIYNPLKEFD